MATWTKVQIREKMMTDDRWLIRGLLAIYNGQTSEEKAIGVTKEDNGIGFNGCDAEILTSIAQAYLMYRRLSPKQIAIVRNKMGKYAGQLLKIAKANTQRLTPASL